MFFLCDGLSLLMNKPYFASKSLPLDSLSKPSQTTFRSHFGKIIPDYLSIAFWHTISYRSGESSFQRLLLWVTHSDVLKPLHSCASKFYPYRKRCSLRTRECEFDNIAEFQNNIFKVKILFQTVSSLKNDSNFKRK